MKQRPDWVLIVVLISAVIAVCAGAVVSNAKSGCSFALRKVSEARSAAMSAVERADGGATVSTWDGDQRGDEAVSALQRWQAALERANKECSR